MKVTFKDFEVPGRYCSICDEDLGPEGADPYYLNTDGGNYVLCDRCGPRIRDLLKAVGVEVEWPERVVPPALKRGWSTEGN